MNRTLVLALSIACAALAALNIYQYASNTQLRNELASLDPARDTGKTSAGANGSLAGSAATGNQPSRAAKAQRQRPLGRTTRETDQPGQPGEGNAQEAFEEWSKMMDNPVMKRQMRVQMEAQLGPALSDLFDHLALEGEDLSYFKDLLAEQWVAQQQVGMKMMSAIDDPEKTQAIKDELKETKEGVDAKVREFLNDEDDYAYYKDYQEQLPDRMELEQFTAALDVEGLALDDNQKNDLLTAMGEERAATGLGDISNPEGWDFQNFNESAIEEVMTMTSDFHHRVQLRAAPILDSEQLAVLTSSQEAQRSMQEAGMKMGLQFMRNAAGGEE